MNEKSKSASIIVGSLVLLLIASTAVVYAQGGPVAIVPYIEASPEEEIQIPILVANITDSQGFNFTLIFDPMVIRVLGVQLIGNSSDFGGPVIDNETGYVKDAIVNYDGITAQEPQPVVYINATVVGPPDSYTPLNLTGVEFSINVSGEFVPIQAETVNGTLVVLGEEKTYNKTYNVSGTVYYEGKEIAPVFVVAFNKTPSEGSEPVAFDVLDGPGDYVLHLPNGTYYILAYMDLNENGTCDPDEPVGFAINKTDFFEMDPIIVDGADVFDVDITLIIPPLRMTGKTCAGICHINAYEVQADYVPNATLSFNATGILLGIFKDYAAPHLGIIPEPIIELYYNTSELYPPDTRGSEAFDEFRPPPYIEDISAGYLMWALPNITDFGMWVGAFDYVLPGLLQDVPRMEVERTSQQYIVANGTYWTTVTVNVSDCFRVGVEVTLINDTSIKAEPINFTANGPVIFAQINNSSLVVIFENNGPSWNPTNGTFTVTVFYNVTKYITPVIEYKPEVRVWSRVRVQSDVLSGIVYNNSYNVSLSSVLYDRWANFSSSVPLNWTTEEFKMNLVTLREYYNVTEAKPDLVVIAKDEIHEGETYAVEYIIQNKGKATADAGFKVALFVDGVLVDKQVVPVPLAPNDTYASIFNVSIPYSSPPEDIVEVWVDYNDTVDELDESNNVLINTYIYPAPGGLKVLGNATILWNVSYMNASLDIKLADLNMDGKKDLIFTSDDKVVALSGEDGTRLWEHPTGIKYIKLLLVELNKDGVMDILALPAEGDRIVAINGTSGDELWNVTLPGEFYDGALADVNGDGTLDIVALVAINTSTNITVILSNGTELYSMSLEAWNLVKGKFDFDGNNMGDILVVNGSGIMFALRGYDGYELWNTSAIPVWFSEFDCYPTDDINGDGIREILAESDMGAMILDGANGSVLFDFKEDLISPSFDIDKDGKDEFVTYDGNNITLWYSDGTKIWDYGFGDYWDTMAYGPFVCGRFIDSENNTTFLKVVRISKFGIEWDREYELAGTSWGWPHLAGDLNGDGEPDIAMIAGWGADGMAIDGATGDVLWMVYNASVLLLGDFNGDDKGDIFYGEIDKTTFMLFNGTGASGKDLAKIFEVRSERPFEYAVPFKIYEFGAPTNDELEVDLTGDGLGELILVVDPFKPSSEIYVITTVGPAEQKPDLIVEIDLNVSEVIEGQPVEIELTVWNVGSEVSNDTALNLYVDGSKVATFVVPALDPGENALFEYTYTFTAGYHVVEAVVDPDKSVNETNEMNNRSTLELNAIILKPDLTVRLQVPSYVVSDQPVNIGVIVENIGLGSSDMTSVIVLVDDVAVITFNVLALAPGENTSFNLEYTFAEGQHTVVAIVDPSNIVDELNETNNVTTKIVTAEFITVIKVDSGAAPKNETTTVNVTAINAENLSNFLIKISYDPSVVMVVDVQINPIFTGAEANLDYATEGWISFGTYSNTVGYNGTVWLATLTLKAVGDEGDKTYLNITQAEILDPDLEDIPYVINNGTFTVGLPRNGDINNDGAVSLKDVIYLFRHLLGKKGYEVLYADGDINNDGAVSLKDVIYLFRHLLGKKGYEVLYALKGR